MAQELHDAGVCARAQVKVYAERAQVQVDQAMNAAVEKRRASGMEAAAPKERGPVGRALSTLITGLMMLCGMGDAPMEAQPRTEEA
eukprot:805623-Prymnesium_polylepis.1